MSPVSNLLERLCKVRKVKDRQWTACCPSHDDRTPSLSIKEGDDGRVLVHCWSGCATLDIVAAVGLELRDLFEATSHQPRRPGPSREALAHERMIYEMGAAALLRGESLSIEDAARFATACKRLGVPRG